MNEHAIIIQSERGNVEGEIHTMEQASPISEIYVRYQDDNDTLPSELSTLLTTTDDNNKYMNEYNNMHKLHGSSHRLSQPTYPTGPTQDSGETQTSTLSRKAFQCAAVLGFLSLLVLLYADVLANIHSTAENQIHTAAIAGDPLNLDASNNVSPSSGVRGRLTESSEDGYDYKQFFWEKDTHPKPKSSKIHDGKEKGSKQGKSKPSKSPKCTKKCDSNVVDDSLNFVHTEQDANMMNYDFDDETVYNNPQKNLHEEPKLIPSDVIAAVTMMDDSRANKEIKSIDIPTAQSRCPYVIQTFEDENTGVSKDFLREKYFAQSVDSNVFYRATALLFWKDFGARFWGKDQNISIDLEEMVLLNEARYEDGTPLSPMSTWTWVTGDQHLSNFGAWRNRGREVVFSVNDFDQAAIYDFQVDVLRIAVSICNHGFTNGLTVEEISEALATFTYRYAKTVIDYVGGDTALLYELNPDTSTGVLRDFLVDVAKKKSEYKQLEKFTTTDKNGMRRFILNNETSRLVSLPIELKDKILAEITSTKYGASMMKMGWRVRGWNDDFFTVLDIARRVGSGIGSYGVDRFYILLKGVDTSLDQDGDSSVILDVKYEPKSAVSRILDENTNAWYAHMFQNEADRVAQAQRRLTSFTDPYVGWIEIDKNPYYIRQLSPWKTALPLDSLTDHRAFVEFIEQIAIATATSHVRGSVSKSPGQFKHVIKVLLAGDRNRSRWSNLVSKIAFHYRNQVLLDFHCFKEYVNENFPVTSDGNSSRS